MKIYITRHGETKWNSEGKFQGRLNSDLNENGIEAAKKLGDRLKEVEFNKIYCSPLGRTRETLDHILCGKGANIEYCEDLKEMSFGIWEGMKFDDIKKDYAEEFDNFWNKPHLYKTIEGETYEELLERISRFINYIKDSHKEDENILIVAHGGVIRAIWSIVKEYELNDFWKKEDPFLTGGSLTIIENKDGKLSFVLEADASHL